MTNEQKFEQKFYNALKDLFVGAKIEGESGYINLMRIKSKYYEEKVFPKLHADIESALNPFPEFKEELFDKLYTFFSRYFSESGSIYFTQTRYHQSVYEKIYTDDKDVFLFWKTHMLYYVKTDRLFKDMAVEVDDFKFFFDVSTLEHKKANEKRDIIYDLKEKREDGTIVFNVLYSEKGRKTKTDEILKALKKKGVRITEEVLEKAFRVFERQSEVDYFINKNAKKFLKEQFDLWLYQYVFSGESEWTEKRIKQLRVLKDIAYKVIDFISQFEDELVKIWNKPKFVLNSNYVITFDRIAERKGGIEVIEKILNHENFDEQVKEWKDLGIVDESFRKDEILENNITGKRLNAKYQFLPIDTIYFKDLELEILGLFDDLDNSLDGWLIKSENYQALNTILPKFKEKVQTIYIDPPFNKEQDADYFYSVKYKDATWISLLENRLRLARDFLKDTGSIFVRCDYNGNWLVRPLMNEIFGEENFRNEIIIKKGKRTESKERNKFENDTEYLSFYAKNKEKAYLLIPLKEKDPEKLEWTTMFFPEERGDPYRIFFGIKIKAPQNTHWQFSQERIDEEIQKGNIRIICNKCGYIHQENIKISGCPKCGGLDFRAEYMRKEIPVNNDWTDILGYTYMVSKSTGFPTENSEILLKRVIESTSNKDDLVMDFFLGSGTTTAVAHKLKRKWIGVEMGEHFYTVTLPRMKKVLAYDKTGISKEKDVKEKYNEKNAGGFFKYYELEQYEDTLKRVKYEDTDLFDNPYEDPYNQYIFMKDLKLLEALEIDYDNNKVKVDLSKLYENIDIAETLSNLLGKWIKRITSDYVEFEDGEKINIKDLDYKLIKPLIWW